MVHGRVMGLDVGDRRIGVAFSDTLGMIATGFSTLVRKNKTYDVDMLATWARERDASRIVVGWPLEPSGKPGRQAQRVQDFVALLTTNLSLPVDYWDERMTSIQAERALLEAGTRRSKRRLTVDKVAATLILQSWLDAHPSTD